MKVEKKTLEKSQIELNIELSLGEFKPFIEKGVIKISKDVKIEGFRPGKAPYDIVKQKVGEMAILEEAGRLAVNDTLGKAIKDNIESQPVGQPKVDITKLAPNNPFGYKVVLAMLPEVKLGSYRDLEIKQKKVEVSEKELEKMFNDFKEMRAQEVAVDRAIQDTDKILLDIQMFLDNVPLEGGQSKGAAIIVGKDFIVAGFDKQLIGAKKGETREFKLPYPKDFHMKNMAGKMVEFKVSIKDVFERKLPELNDDIAKGFGVKNLAEFKENMKKSMHAQKEKEQTQAAERAMLEKIIEKANFGDIPEMLIKSESENMMHELEHAIAEQGGKFEDYLTSLNKTKDQLTLDMLPEAIKRVKISLLLRELAVLEKVKAEDKEIDEHIADLKKTYKDNKQAMEQVDTPEYRTYITNLLTSQKVINKLKGWNIRD